METAAELAAFLTDFGKPVVCGAVTTTGILDMPGAVQLGDQVTSTDYALRYLTSTLPDLDHDDALTVDGVAYTVRFVLPVTDGKFSIATLQKA